MQSPTKAITESHKNDYRLPRLPRLDSKKNIPPYIKKQVPGSVFIKNSRGSRGSRTEEPMNATEINQRYNLRGLVESHTTLRKHGAALAGPCPICSQGKDRFVLLNKKDGWRWYLRQCAHAGADGKYHGPIDYVMLKFNLEFKQAASKMAAEMGGNLEALPRLARPAAAPRPVIELPSDEFRQKLWALTHRANHTLLETAQGEPARVYLASRGLAPVTLARALLGYEKSPVTYGRPAIVIPYFDEDRKTYTITGVKFRFFDDLAKRDKCKRYGAPKFSENETSKFYLYGMFGLCQNADSLLLVEGDLNRNSIWQLSPRGTHVLSLGSENIGEAQKEILKIITPKYPRLIIWSDNPDRAKAIQEITARPDAITLESSIQNGVKLDANELLQRGELASHLAPFGLIFDRATQSPLIRK